MPNSITGRYSARQARRAVEDKQTHKLIPQTCVVWVPERAGYVSSLSPDTLRSVDHPARARHLTEDEAEELALAVRSQTGLRAAIRPYYALAQV